MARSVWTALRFAGLMVEMATVAWVISNGSSRAALCVWAAGFAVWLAGSEMSRPAAGEGRA